MFQIKDYKYSFKMKKLKYLIFSIFALLRLSLSFNVEARTSASNSALIAKMKSPFDKNGWFHTFEWYGTATEAETTTDVEFLRSGNAVRIDPGQTSVTYYDYILVPDEIYKDISNIELDERNLIPTLSINITQLVLDYIGVSVYETHQELIDNYKYNHLGGHNGSILKMDKYLKEI